MANWIAGAIKHPGALTRSAHRAGQSPMAFAKSHAGAGGVTGRRARLALTLSKLHHNPNWAGRGKIPAAPAGAKIGGLLQQLQMTGAFQTPARAASAAVARKSKPNQLHRAPQGTSSWLQGGPWHHQNGTKSPQPGRAPVTAAAMHSRAHPTGRHPGAGMG